MIKIVYVINYITKNGPSRVVLDLIRHLDKDKFDVSLITLFSGNDPDVIQDLQEGGTKTYACTTLSRAKCLLGESREFNKIVANHSFDILHSHGLIPDILSAWLDVPVPKRISTIHNNMFEDYLDSYGYIRSRIFIAMHMAALKHLDQCVCCSKSVYDVMRRYLNNASYVRNGIEPVPAHTVVTKEQLKIPNGARVFLYAGVLNSGKHIVWLIENFVRYRFENEYLLVLGDGEKQTECRQKSDDHVRMLGYQTDPISYMNISDIYVSASKSEGFSISVLEALSCGLGLLLSDIPSHNEVISMGNDCHLGETFNEDNFNEALKKMRREHIDKEQIKKFQIAELSAAKMARQYIGIYIG